MKSKRITWFVLLAFCLTIVGPLLVPAPVEAAGTSEIVAELNNLYQYMDEKDKADLGAARANIPTINWDAILDNSVITTQVSEAFEGEDKAKEALKAFAIDFSKIYYSTEPDILGDTINNFKITHKDTFQKLFGTDVTVDDLFTLLNETRKQVPEVVTIGEAKELARCNSGELIAKMPDIMKRALAAAITDDFKGKLSVIGWSVDGVVTTKNKIATKIDSGNKAELALAKAAVRSHAEIAKKGGTTIEPVGITRQDTIPLGTEVNYELSIMGYPATGLVDWAISNSNIAELTCYEAGTPNQSYGMPISPKKAGTAILTAYRAGGDSATDWILKLNLTVKSSQSDNANLSSLTLSSGKLKPEFSSSNTEYIALVNDKEVPKIIEAKAQDPTAKVEVTQAASLDKRAKVVVTAGDGKTTKIYWVGFAIEMLIPTDGKPIKASGAPIALKVTNIDSGKATLPKLEVTGGAADVSIPDGTVVQGPADWDGIMVMPTVRTEASAKVEGENVFVLEVGAGKDKDGKDIVLTFTKAVRLLVPGQGGKAAAYIRNGKPMYITRTLAADNQKVADENIPDAGEASIDVDNDKAIWTKHFTEFLTYTPKSSEPPSSSSGGGGGGGLSWKTIKSAEGGKLSEYGATVQIPVNAFEAKEFKIRIDKVRDTSKLSLVSGTKLLGTVVDIITEKSISFTKPVTVTLNFDKSKVDTSMHDISLYWLNTSTNKWTELDNVKLDINAGKVSGEVNHFTKFAIIATEKEGLKPQPGTPTPVVTLTDISGHWAQANIQKLVEAGAISGYPDKTFKPDANISRAEFAVTLVKSLKLAPKQGKVFDDTADHWAKDFIATAQAYGIISGYSDTLFGPEDKITREQMAVMVVKAANLVAGENPRTFTDSDQVSAWAKDAVIAASSNGVISGYPDGSFKPQANATRAEAVTVIVKIIK